MIYNNLSEAPSIATLENRILHELEEDTQTMVGRLSYQGLGLRE